jgi:hypothetical protein
VWQGSAIDLLSLFSEEAIPAQTPDEDLQFR